MTAPGLRIGFGCGNLGGEVSRRRSRALLEAAYDAGIRHFDVAPSYGGGMAESVVGEVLARLRDDIVLVSKAGIPHPRGAGVVRAARQLLVPLRRLMPGLWQRAGVRVRRAAAPLGRFRPAEIRATVTESLRRLRTDRLDALLLHEARPGDVSAELRDVLRGLRSEGRTGALGLASGVEPTLALLQEQPGLFDWVQTDHFWGAFEPALRDGRRLVTHRVLRTGLALVGRPAFQAELRRRGATQLLAAVSDPAAVADLLLRAAVARVGPAGIVLVSTSRPERLRRMAAAAAHDPTPALTAELDAALVAMRGAGS